MVRAAAAGVIDYSQADPDDSNWYLRHRLLLNEVQRQDQKNIIETAQRHWLAYIAHGSLTEESFANTVKHANELLDDYYNLLFPWTVEKDKKAKTSENQAEAKVTIDKETQALIDEYKRRYPTENEQ